jgi:hypothetical protein
LRAGKPAVVLLAVTAAVVASRGVSAHRLDECLQAARIAIEPTHVELELDLTPGMAVADAIVAEVDRDRDGSLSAAEKQAFVRRVLSAIDLENDGRSLDVTPGATTFAAIDALRRGEGMIRFRADARLPNQSPGTHHIVFRNRYRAAVSAYLANALVPESDRVAVTTQHHDAQQRDLTIDYVVQPEQATSRYAWVLGTVASMSVLAALLIPSRTRREPGLWRRLFARRRRCGAARPRQSGAA